MKPYLIPALALLAVSCSQEAITPDQPRTGEPVALQVNVLGVKTRALMEGDTIPDGTKFSLFVKDAAGKFLDDGCNVPVTWQNGKAETAKPIMLWGDEEKLSVFAGYPDSVTYTDGTMSVNAINREDYLWASSKEYAGYDNPTVDLLFTHIMARITLRVSRTDFDQLNQDYDKVEFYLGGDLEGQYRTATANLATQELSDFTYGQYENIKAIGDDYMLYPDQTVVRDFLVIPSTTTWQFYMAATNVQGWYYLPERTYQSGQQYIYDVVIGAKGATLKVKTVEIKPWVENEMPEINVQ